MINKFRLFSVADAALLEEKFKKIKLEDGQDTAGSFVKSIKNNSQITTNNKEGMPILAAIQNHLIDSKYTRVIAYPKAVGRIMANVHRQGNYYGVHVDNTWIGKLDKSIRADISFTIFLSSPSSYEGGELSIHQDIGKIDIKLEPGEIVLYDSGALHEVKPVLSGERICVVGWIQSWIQDATARAAMTEFDQSIAKIKNDHDLPRERLDELHKIYNQFLRLMMK